MLRLIHAWNALVIVLLVITAMTAEWLVFAWPAAAVRQLHLWLGYLLILGLVARVIWGLAGPPHACWSALWHPAQWITALRSRTLFTEAPAFGHHPLASAVYLLLYLILLVAAVSGLALAAIDQAQGPLFEWLGYHLEFKSWFRLPHAWLDEVLLAFIAVHLAALILHEKIHRVPLAQSMVSGYQYRKEE